MRMDIARQAARTRYTAITQDTDAPAWEDLPKGQRSAEVSAMLASLTEATPALLGEHLEHVARQVERTFRKDTVDRAKVVRFLHAMAASWQKRVRVREPA